MLLSNRLCTLSTPLKVCNQKSEYTRAVGVGDGLKENDVVFVFLGGQLLFNETFLLKHTFALGNVVFLNVGSHSVS